MSHWARYLCNFHNHFTHPVDGKGWQHLRHTESLEIMIVSGNKIEFVFISSLCWYVCVFIFAVDHTLYKELTSLDEYVIVNKIFGKISLISKYNVYNKMSVFNPIWWRLFLDVIGIYLAKLVNIFSNLDVCVSVQNSGIKVRFVIIKSTVIWKSANTKYDAVLEFMVKKEVSS